MTAHDPSPSYEMLVGLQVTDDERYVRYRAGMGPILAAYGGSFRYDLRVSEVLRNEAGNPMNRVFVIAFPDRAASERFFADPDYLAVRAEHFEPSVGATTILAAYDRRP